MDFHVSRDFYLCAHINFTRVNIIEAMCEVLPVNAKIERQLSRLRATFHILPLFYLRTQKLRDSGNPPKATKAVSV